MCLRVRVFDGFVVCLIACVCDWLFVCLFVSFVR